MNQILTDAQSLHDEIITNRRTIHQFAEIGFDLPQTYAYIFNKLTEYGYQPKKVGKMGITCLAGKPGRTILLRADMDALPMAEESGESFAAVNGHCHSCGHDCHSAMLLGAAKLLKQRENELHGTVEFMFQPAEEIMGGAKDMLDNGILENPKVDMALGLHIITGNTFSKTGRICCIHHCVAVSGDAVKITVHGKDAHGSLPENGVDAIHIAAHIILALEELTARELPMEQDSIVLVGRIAGGTTCNSVAGEAVLEVSIRTNSPKEREFLLKRVEEIAVGVAATFRGCATVEHLYGVPPLVNPEPELQEFQSYLREMLPRESVADCPKMGGSEDFTMLAEKVPAVFLQLGVGSIEEGYTLGPHQPAMRVNESALPIGTAVYAQCAMRWLENHNS